MGKEWRPSLWKDTSPSKAFKDSEKQCSMKAMSENNRKAKDCETLQKISQRNESSKGRKAYSTHDGGTSPDDIDDVSPDHLETLQKNFIGLSSSDK